MLEHGIEVDVLCYDKYQFVKNSKKKHSLVLSLLLRLPSLISNSFYLRVWRRLLYKATTKLLIKQYDLVDFHVYSDSNIPLMHFCHLNNIPYDITIWGSEILRASNEELLKKTIGFEKCRHIKSTENILEAVSERYLGRFDEKCHSVYWGNNDFETINSLPSEAIQKIKEDVFGIKDDEIVITCGYNGTSAQNHIRILNMIETIPQKYKDKIHLIIPMTYGADNSYINDVKAAALKSGYVFDVLEHYLSKEENATLRVITDIAINMQQTDGFSGSLQGHLYCKNILVIADWLDYPALDKKGVYYIKTSFDSMKDIIINILSDLPKYKSMCVGNTEKMRQITSWSVVKKQWADSYMNK